MIIWISGAYGVGKSTLAEALVNKIENAMVFDAEEVGSSKHSGSDDFGASKFLFKDNQAVD